MNTTPVAQLIRSSRTLRHRVKQYIVEATEQEDIARVARSISPYSLVFLEPPKARIFPLILRNGRLIAPHAVIMKMDYNKQIIDSRFLLITPTAITYPCLVCKNISSRPKYRCAPWSAQCVSGVKIPMEERLVKLRARHS